MGLMGILTEIGVMRCTVLVLLSVWSGAAGASCPSLCSCRGPAADGPEAGASAAGGGPAGAGPAGAGPAAAGAEPPPGEPLRLRCGGGPVQITELKEIDFTNIWGSVISLNMSGNAIGTLSRDLHLPSLQKLDLSHNQITLIESDAFYNVSGLQRLDLSHNQIGAVSREMFKGLARLERLLLAHNRLRQLPADTFDHLVALKLLDITENRLVCDCALLWLGEWARAGLRLAGVPRCAAPPPLAGRALRKLRLLLDLAACAAPPLPAPAALRLRPARDQLVFQGDALALVCSAPFASALHPSRLRWAHPPLDACDLNVTDADVRRDGVAETTALMPNVTARHAGDWTCLYEDDDHVRHNRTIKVVVVSNATRYCVTDHTVDNKGLLAWPTLLPNRTAEVACRAGGASATRLCGADGHWRRPDTSRCGYLGNVTKLLQQFALLDAGLVQYSALNASARLAALLRETARADIRDPDDVMFVAQAARNYMRYVSDERELGSALLDVVSAAMLVPRAVMARAELQYGACSELLRVAERLASTAADKQKSNLAVESLPVRGGFGGATCVWSAAPDTDTPGTDTDTDTPATPRLHCTTTNRTVALAPAEPAERVYASVQIPASLGAGAASLVVSMFLDAALFPLLPEDEAPEPHRAKDYYGRSTKCEDCNLEITSPVVSVHLDAGAGAPPPPEPLRVTLRAAACAREPRCAVWDARARRWRRDDGACAVLRVAGCAAQLALARPGAVALLARAERGVYGARPAGARFKLSHPAVYVGSLVLLGCLAAAALTYAAAFPAVLMPRRAKHALLNTWLAMAALCLLYTLGIYQTEDARLCRALGLLLHYLSLCCLLWMCAAAHVTRESVARARGPRRPVLGLYLVGWGAALVVCGISGAVDLRAYAGYAQCFLSSGAALGALLGPAALLLPLLLALLLLARRAARDRSARVSEGTQATEHVELDAWEPAPPDARSGASADSEPSDAERAPAVLLRAQAVVLALFLAAWASGAVAVYRPLPSYLPYQEDICSILYAVCATVLGTFVLFFYGIARSDVRAQWALVPRLLRRRERCCRGRAVAASAPPGVPPGSPGLPPGPPGPERPASRDLLLQHRRQYRVAGAAGSPPARVGPEAFYNPNQMNVAKKFFKRQRQNGKRPCLELPVRRDFDEESRASPPPREPPGPPREPPGPPREPPAAAPATPGPQLAGGTRTVSQQCSLASGSASSVPDAGSARCRPPAAPEPRDREACSTDASEQGFENESDISCPNYQASEVSIRSHGLYAPSPSSVGPNEMGFSAEDVSPGDSPYANVAGWRPPRASCSDLDELYTRITAGTLRPRAGRGGTPDVAGPGDVTLDVTGHSDVTLRPDSAASEPRTETAV